MQICHVFQLNDIPFVQSDYHMKTLSSITSDLPHILLFISDLTFEVSVVVQRNMSIECAVTLPSPCVSHGHPCRMPNTQPHPHTSLIHNQKHLLNSTFVKHFLSIA